MVPAGASTQVLDFPASRIELQWLSSQDADARVIERAGSVTFLEGYAYTYIVTGAENDPFILATEVGVNRAAPGAFVDATPVASDASQVPLRAFNALAEPLDIRVRLDGITVAGELAPRQASDKLRVPPAVYTLRIGPTTDDNAPAYYVGELSLVDVPPVTLFVYGSPDEPAIALLPDYTEPAQPGQAVIRIIHAVAGAEDLVVAFDMPGLAPATGAGATPTPGPLDSYESVPFGPGQTSGFVGLPANTYDIYVRRAADSEVVAIVPRLALEGRMYYDLLLLPGSGAGSYEVILLPAPLES